MEWQPIETAPTDCGILVYDAEYGVAKAKFFDKRYTGATSWEVQTYTTCCMDYYNNVTHWMPLPEPPKES